MARGYDPTSPPFRVQAFGAGVQSSTLLSLWALESEPTPRSDGTTWRGFFPQGRPDLVVFADTQAESHDVYDAVDDARAQCDAAGVPFEVVTAGDLAHPRVASTGTQGIFTPLFTVSLEPRTLVVTQPLDPFAIGRFELLREVGEMRGRTAEEEAEFAAIATHDVAVVIPPGEEGQLRRQCTSAYKIEPMMARVYELAGKRPIEVWLGISVDEIERIKTGPNDRVRYFYPLVFNQDRTADQEYEYGRLAPVNRHDCATYLRELETPIVKSACVFCPYRSEYAWAAMKRNDPASFERACAYDERMRAARPGYNCYVHRSRRPLREVDFAAANPLTLDLFTESDASASGGCEEGYCGL